LNERIERNGIERNGKLLNGQKFLVNDGVKVEIKRNLEKLGYLYII